MKHEFCYFKSYLSKEICEQILHDSAHLEFQTATVGDHSKKTANDTIRISRTKFLYNNNPAFNIIFDSLWKTGLRANLDFWNFHITKLETVQLAEYDSIYLGEYKVHQDVIWKTEGNFHRKLTCVVQLSNPHDYEGIEFEITEPGMIPVPQEEVKAQGTMIFFPSMLRHKANPVTKGIRHSLAAWFEGPLWR